MIAAVSMLSPAAAEPVRFRLLAVRGLPLPIELKPAVAKSEDAEENRL